MIPMYHKLAVLSLLALVVSVSLLGTLSFQSSSYQVQSAANKSPSAFRIELFRNLALTHRIRNGRAVEGSTVYVDVVLLDARGNPVNYTGTGLLQLTLALSAGTISATNVYISSGHSDTEGSFGGILWTLPSHAGLKVDINSTASINGKVIYGSASLITVRHRYI